MLQEVRLPEIAENVETGVVITALVKAGDFVEKDEPLIELETEKATFEVPSPFAGKVVEIAVKEEDEIKVGQVIAKIDTEAKAGERKEEKPAKPEPAPAAEEEKEEAAVSEAPEEPEPVREGPLPVQEEAPAPEPVEPAPAKKKEEEPALPAEVSAAPAVRQLARELGIDISRVAGSGPGGRISAEDVKNYARNIIAGGAPRGGAAAAGISIPLPDFSKWGEVERQPMTVTRRKIAETLSFSWANVPHVTQHDQADVTALEQFRAEYGQRVQQAGGKLTMTAILMKVVASALQAFPKFNASVDAERNQIILKKYCHISVAVDTERGLVVPVVRDADKKSILQLSIELKNLAEKARSNKLTPEDMTGGNFTISNLGGIGGTNFSPIIYWPQVAILGVSRAAYCVLSAATGSTSTQYAVRGTQHALMLPLSLSYDHRIIDGTEGLRFLRWIVETLEKPFLLAAAEETK